MRYKKANRIMMIAVSLLLALVLLTTCVLSGIYAKYVTQSEVPTKIVIKKLGLTINVKENDTVISKVQETKQGNFVSLTYSSFNIRPGVEENGLIKFFISGTPTVPVRVTVRVNVTTDERCMVPESVTLNSNDTDAVYIPFTFKVGTVSESWGVGNLAVVAGAPFSAASCAELDEQIESAVAESIKTRMNSDTAVANDANGYYVSKDFTRDANGNVAPIAFNSSDRKGIAFGFKWPIDANDKSSDDDLIETYLAKKFGTDGVPLTFTFTVSIEQIGA